MSSTTIENLEIAPYGERGAQPNPTQKKVLAWVDRVREGKHPGKGIPILYLQGGVGCGKTRAFLAPMIEMLTQIPGLRALWSRQDYNDLRLSAMETFFEIVPNELIVGKSTQEHRYVVGQADGKEAQIFFRELKDLSGLGSQEFGVIIVTEAHEISNNALRVLKMRCRQAGVPSMILMEGNPPNAGHWLDNLTKQGKAEYDADVEKWEVSTYENWNNLPEAYKASLETMPQSWKLKYLFGKTGFTPDGKPFYDGYDERLHKRSLPYIPGRKIYRGIDFGYHHPACVWCGFDAKDRFMVLAELMGTDITIEKFAENSIIPFENQKFPKQQFETYYDPAGVAVTDKSEKTSVEILADKGITGACKQSTYRERKELVERKLSTLIDSIPSLVVDESCGIINDGFLGGYHYPITKEGKPDKEEPDKDGYYEHLMNALEYVIVNLFQVRQRKGTGKTAYTPANAMAA